LLYATLRLANRQSPALYKETRCGKSVIEVASRGTAQIDDIARGARLGERINRGLQLRWGPLREFHHVDVARRRIGHLRRQFRAGNSFAHEVYFVRIRSVAADDEQGHFGACLSVKKAIALECRDVLRGSLVNRPNEVARSDARLGRRRSF